MKSEWQVDFSRNILEVWSTRSCSHLEFKMLFEDVLNLPNTHSALNTMLDFSEIVLEQPIEIDTYKAIPFKKSEVIETQRKWAFLVTDNSCEALIRSIRKSTDSCRCKISIFPDKELAKTWLAKPIITQTPLL